MTLELAPLHQDVCKGDLPGTAYWVRASDGMRLRLGLWQAEAAKGTVLLFPGRTEYIEKYAGAGSDFAARGLTTLAIDWRGQGLADRMLDNPRIGHVRHFSDYQLDVAAMIAAAETLNLPRPFYLLGHSMGGCIGLRTAMTRDDLAAVAFTGPMWGIRIPPMLRPVAHVIKHLFPAIGLGGVTPPTTVPEPYVLNAPFENNTLTGDPEMWEMMRHQIQTHPDVSLGGPSIIWMREAMAECADLARQPSPGQPCLTFLGTNERIVEKNPIITRMENWPKGTINVVAGGQHEVMMEGPDVRRNTFDSLAAHFLAHGA